MLEKRLAEVLAMAMIGDGVLALLFPRKHVALWRGGPRWYDRTLDAFLDHPDATRALGGLEAGLGVWLAYRQWDRLRT